MTFSKKMVELNLRENLYYLYFYLKVDSIKQKIKGEKTKIHFLYTLF